jgi:hypothetical protein
LGNTKSLSCWALNLQTSRALKLSGPRVAYAAYTKVNLRVGRESVNIDFTGPGWALDAPDLESSNFHRFPRKLRF